jgi:hypothetical protein
LLNWIAGLVSPICVSAQAAGCEIGLRGDLVGDVQELPLLLENPEKFT